MEVRDFSFQATWYTEPSQLLLTSSARVESRGCSERGTLVQRDGAEEWQLCRDAGLAHPRGAAPLEASSVAVAASSAAGRKKRGRCLLAAGRKNEEREASAADWSEGREGN